MKAVDLDTVPYDGRFDRVATRSIDHRIVEPVETFEEAVTYAYNRARELGVRQVLRSGVRLFGPGHRFWYCRSITLL